MIINHARNSTNNCQKRRKNSKSKSYSPITVLEWKSHPRILSQFIYFTPLINYCDALSLLTTRQQQNNRKTVGIRESHVEQHSDNSLELSQQWQPKGSHLFGYFFLRALKCIPMSAAFKQKALRHQSKWFVLKQKKKK